MQKLKPGVEHTVWTGAVDDMLQRHRGRRVRRTSNESMSPIHSTSAPIEEAGLHRPSRQHDGRRNHPAESTYSFVRAPIQPRRRAIGGVIGALLTATASHSMKSARPVAPCATRGARGCGARAMFSAASHDSNSSLACPRLAASIAAASRPRRRRPRTHHRTTHTLHQPLTDVPSKRCTHTTFSLFQVSLDLPFSDTGSGPISCAAWSTDAPRHSLDRARSGDEQAVVPRHMIDMTSRGMNFWATPTAATSVDLRDQRLPPEDQCGDEQVGHLVRFGSGASTWASCWSGTRPAEPSATSHRAFPSDRCDDLRHRRPRRPGEKAACRSGERPRVLTSVTGRLVFNLPHRPTAAGEPLRHVAEGGVEPQSEHERLGRG